MLHPSPSEGTPSASSPALMSLGANRGGHVLDVVVRRTLPLRRRPCHETQDRRVIIPRLRKVDMAQVAARKLLRVWSPSLALFSL
jgi:hypothetical protein